jgi:hypothetical protein
MVRCIQLAASNQQGKHMTQDWFYNTHSNDELCDILSEFSKHVTGFRVAIGPMGRCSIARELEALSATAKMHLNLQKT